MKQVTDEQHRLLWECVRLMTRCVTEQDLVRWMLRAEKLLLELKATNPTQYEERTKR